jgi:hypothetical protein
MRICIGILFCLHVFHILELIFFLKFAFLLYFYRVVLLGFFFIDLLVMLYS